MQGQSRPVRQRSQPRVSASGNRVSGRAERALGTRIEGDVGEAEQERRRHDRSRRPEESAGPREGLAPQQQFLRDRGQHHDEGEPQAEHRRVQEGRETDPATEIHVECRRRRRHPGDVDHRPEREQQPEPPHRQTGFQGAGQSEPLAPGGAAGPGGEPDHERGHQHLPQGVHHDAAPGHLRQGQPRARGGVRERVDAEPQIAADTYDEDGEAARQKQDGEWDRDEQQHPAEP
ncbi:hypothetical protein MetexDRAFT_1109 [Methylorubrum extorquens DSM 13060]|uniref:Uncharacterized protein n=1 Tax=Methylorubrum extorquens DSM 13060 TaxID=882800 RepID=H1KEP7_METEX|nr:hypothetical protein MetexDRAFT_1109 [Methylorubrum extorquens DSM 13060]